MNELLKKVIGIFRSLQPVGLEFHAVLALPYQKDFDATPMHGQFILVELETPTTAIVGRITSFSSEGKLSSDAGEDFNIRSIQEGRDIPEDIREKYLKYRVNIRLLGVINKKEDKLIFVPSHRRLPHVGSRVGFPKDEVLREIAGHNIEGTAIGHLALGEYIYAHKSKFLKEPESWMCIVEPEVLIKFKIESLVSRRTFIFARAGFGKSNLTKLLFSTLYKGDPKVSKRGGKEVPVGTIIFDTDGEYFWPDDKGRPGLCDVSHLQDKLVVFTEREAPSAYYGSFIAGGVKLDIRNLRPSDVISVALDPDRQEQQNVRKLRGLSQENWKKLVDLIAEKGNEAPIEEISKLLGLDHSKQEVEAIAARSNMNVIVRMLHEKDSKVMDMLLEALRNGKLCVLDISQMRGKQAFILSSLILRQIFNINQEEFTKKEPKTIPTIAVVEEAQAVLDEKSSASEPFIAWVKEGRKYDLGMVMITQQPGSIPGEILSQGDNWFIFHLLSAVDLMSLKRANAHFSEDILSSLLNEPIPGHAVFWSSVEGRSYPVNLRVLSFEKMYPREDPEYNREGADTYAKKLSEIFPREIFCDKKKIIRDYLVEKVKDDKFTNDIENKDGILWSALMNKLKLLLDSAPDHIKKFVEELEKELKKDKQKLAYNMVPEVLCEIYGPQNSGWKTERDSNEKTVIKIIRS